MDDNYYWGIKTSRTTRHDMKFCTSVKLIVICVLFFSYYCLCSEDASSLDRVSKRMRADVDDVGEGDHLFQELNSSLTGTRPPLNLTIFCNCAMSTEELRSVETRTPTPHPTHRSIVKRRRKTLEQSDHDDTECEVDAPVSAEIIKWRKNFMAAVQAADMVRLEFLQSGYEDAHFKITSPVDASSFTFPLNFALCHKLDVAVEFILGKMSFDPDALDSFGHTALSLAIELGDYSRFVKLLQVSNLKVPVRGGLGLTHFAASMKTVSPLFLAGLKEKGMDFKAGCGIRGWTPLQYAVTANNTFLTKWIIENTDCNLVYSKNETIVLDALKAGNSLLAQDLIINHDAPFKNVMDGEQRNIFHVIAKTGKAEILPFIISSRFDPIFLVLLSVFDKVKGFCPIHYAAESNNVDIFDIFRKISGLNFKTSDGRSVLELAIASGSVEVISYLFNTELADWRESFIDSDSSILVDSYIKLLKHPRKIEVISTLLDHLTEEEHYLFDGNGLNIIHHAVMNGDMETLRLLKDKYNFDFNTIENQTLDDPIVNSPLSWAIFQNNYEMVEYLLENGASPNEMIRYSLFSIEDGPVFSCQIERTDNDEDGDVAHLKQLAEVFGGKTMEDLITKYI